MPLPAPLPLSSTVAVAAAAATGAAAVGLVAAVADGEAPARPGAAAAAMPAALGSPAGGLGSGGTSLALLERDDLRLLEMLGEGSFGAAAERRATAPGEGADRPRGRAGPSGAAPVHPRPARPAGKVYKGLWRGVEVAVKTMVLPAGMSGAEKREKMVRSGEEGGADGRALPLRPQCSYAARALIGLPASPAPPRPADPIRGRHRLLA